MSCGKKMQSVLVIGGTGAQGSAVVRALSEAGTYKVIALTRSTMSTTATSIAPLPNVALIEGDTYHEPTLRTVLRGVESAFVNTNGFAIGEKAEIYWGIRIYELAREVGVKHFVWGGLDYGLKKADYDPSYRCGHYDGKGKVGEFISAQPTAPMAWTILTSGPYMEMLSELFQPSLDASGTYIFGAPLGAYALWILDNPSDSNGMNLEVATEHVAWDDLAKAYTAVTGKLAKYQPLTMEEHFGSAPHSGNSNDKLGHSADKTDSTLMSYGENFTGFWNMWKASGQNQGVITRDYALLNKILPLRVKNVGDWMRKVNYTGEAMVVLKDLDDSAKRQGWSGNWSRFHKAEAS